MPTVTPEVEILLAAHCCWVSSYAGCSLSGRLGFCWVFFVVVFLAPAGRKERTEPLSFTRALTPKLNKAELRFVINASLLEEWDGIKQMAEEL